MGDFEPKSAISGFKKIGSNLFRSIKRSKRLLVSCSIVCQLQFLIQISPQCQSSLLSQIFPRPFGHKRSKSHGLNIPKTPDVVITVLSREENSSFSHEERGILIRGIPREENRRGKRGIDQYKKAHF